MAAGPDPVAFRLGVVAINLFMLGLIAASIGWSHRSPVATLAVAVPLTLLATRAAVRWFGGLMDEAKR